jgi:hypothetical protein
MDGQVQDYMYNIVDDIIYYKGRIHLFLESKFKEKLLQEFHNSPLVGHQGFLKAYIQIRERFTWRGLKEDVMHHIRSVSHVRKTRMNTPTLHVYYSLFPF